MEASVKTTDSRPSCSGRRPAALYEVTMTLPRAQAGQADLLEMIFCQAGVPAPQTAQTFLKTRLETKTFLPDKKRARRLEIRLRSLRLKDARVRLREVLERDWKDKWKQSIKPFALGKSFFVFPAWVKQRSCPRGRVPIVLDTDLAFGTGLHETTRFVARLIEESRGRFGSFFDIGTGTGLLTVVAARCGADRLTAVDYDPQCVRVARKNLERNNVKNCLLKQADLRTMRAGKQFDLVAANLTSRDLIALRKKIVSFVRPGGYLAVSGISLDHLPEVREAFRAFPLRCLRVLKGKQWAAVKFKRTG